MGEKLEFVTTICACWQARNNLLFGHVLVTSKKMVERAFSLVREYREARVKLDTGQYNWGSVWRAPYTGYLKVNFDGAWIEEESHGLGMMTRDSGCCVVMAREPPEQRLKQEGIFEGNINGVAAIEVDSGRGARLVFFAVAAGFLSCSGRVELLFRFDRCNMKSRAAGKRRAGSSVPTGAGSSHTEQCTKGFTMDEDLRMSSGSEFVPSEAGGSTEDSVSLVEESGGEVGAPGSEGDEVGDDDADSPEGSIQGRSRKRRREPSMEGRRWRHKAAGDGLAFDKDGRGGRGVVPVSVSVSVRGRCTLDKICKFNKVVQPYHTEAMEGTILKPVLEYRPFPMQRDLTTALVKAWVPRRKAFRLAGRLVPFSVYDVAFFTGLPVTGKIVEFAEGDLSTTDIARMVRQRMAQYVTEKSDKLKREKGSKKPVFRNYIKVMKKLLDANNEPKKVELWLNLYAWMVMSGLMFPRTPYGPAWSVQTYMQDIRGLGEYAWAEAVWRVLVGAVEEMQRKLEGHVSDVQMNGSSSFFGCPTTRFAKYDKGMFPRLASWDSVDHGGRNDAFELVTGIKESKIIPVLHPRPEEMGVRTIRDFMKSPEYGVCSHMRSDFIEQGRRPMRSGRSSDKWREGCNFWMSRAHELEARLKLSKAPATQEEGGEQPGGDVGEAIQIETEMKCLGQPGIDLGEAVEHGSREGAGGTPDVPVTIEEEKAGNSIGAPDIVPSPAVEDVGDTMSGSPGMRCGEGMAGGDGADWEHHEAALVHDNSGAVSDADPGDDAGNPEGGVSGCGGEDVGSHTSGGEGVPVGPASGVGNVEVGTGAATAGVGEDVPVEGVVPSVNYGRAIAPETADVVVEDAAVDEACADPPLGQSGESVANPAGDVNRTAGSNSSGNPDVEGVPCEGEGAGDSSNIVTQKTSVPETDCSSWNSTDPTRHHGGRKKQKDLTDEGMGAEKVPGGDEPSEGEVMTEILDVPPIAVEGSQWGADAEDFNTITFWQRTLLRCCRQLRRSSSTQFGGEGCERVLAETGAYELVAGPHQRGPKCRSSGQVREVALHNNARIAAMIWDTFKRPPYADVRYVFMPLLETTEGHWLLLVVDLRDR
ncbi:LOW QUALITY PROTEIN: hypothetical protein Cgig2_029696 [Carnegiea gigantea]|uniref:Ubiquitin-like protease family profile domain-containing protein n=1 Tax=Carnegiea gigantea TaxID=171969 RepID=A0A9Q1QIW4_9CARY|nr:LOW QUALITY PROTEIN: hypothetical protein Cgig2_029696 [Carnegiea gigantea]